MPYENDLDDFEDIFNFLGPDLEEEETCKEDVDSDEFIDKWDINSIKIVPILSGIKEVNLIFPDSNHENWEMIKTANGFQLKRRKSLTEQIANELDVEFNNKDIDKEDEPYDLPF